MASVPLKETFYKPFLYETERANDSFDPPFQIKKKVIRWPFKNLALLDCIRYANQETFY